MKRNLRDFYFTIDLRSLALYRILLAFLLIWDWVARWPDLEAFYTSFGVLPVEAALPKPGGDFHFCLLDGVTTLLMVRAVFCVGLLFYVLFLLGYRTRTFHGLSLVFFTSVLSRNVMIRDGSVVVMATMLMWSLFLPTGNRFSLDALMRRLRHRAIAGAQPPPAEAQRSEPSLAALAIIAQLGLIYFFTAAAKCGSTWKDGTALYYALNMDQIARPLGRWLAAQPLPLIKALTWGSLATEFAALPLMLAPFAQPWLRRLAMAGLVALHLSIALTSTLGFFSAAMVTAYALLLLPEDWERLKALPDMSRIRSEVGELIAHQRNRVANWLWLSASDVDGAMQAEARPDLEPAPAMRWWCRARGWTANSIVAVLFVTFTLDAYNLNMTRRLGRERIPEPRWMRAIILVPLIQQDWELFAPDPTKDDGWWVIAGETESGEQFDPLTGQVPTFDKPADLAFRFDRFWRKYLDRIWLKKNYDYRLYFGKYVTRQNHHEKPEGQRLARFHFYYVKELTQPPGTPQPWPTERRLLWRHECFPSANPAKAER